MKAGRKTMQGSAALALVLAVAGSPQAAEDDQVGVVEKERGAVESFFYEVWSTVRSMSPTARESRTPEGVTVTAGLRGAEGESKAMAPYWKGDLTDDPAFRQEVAAYQKALEKGRDGQPQALERFIAEYGDGELAANARFALGVAHAQAGNPADAREVLGTFREQYAEHPLRDEAQRVLDRLDG